MKLLTLVHHPFELWNTPSWFSERLHQDFPTVEATQESSYEGIEPQLRDAEVIVSWSLRPEQFKVATSCAGFILPRRRSINSCFRN